MRSFVCNPANVVTIFLLYLHLQNFSLMYHPFSIAMQCMWRTKVSSGTISATTADSCDIPYHYQGVSFGNRAAGWSETYCGLQVLWGDGASSPLFDSHQQLRTNSVQPHVTKTHHHGEDQGAWGMWGFFGWRPLGLKMSFIYANCPEHVLYFYVFYGANLKIILPSGCDWLSVFTPL